MWMTKQFIRDTTHAGAEAGTFGLAADVPAVSATMELRDIPLYTPWGISFAPPQGSEVLLIETASGMACAGVRCLPDETLEPGEVRLFSKGARILIKNNGEIQLGSVHITPDGQIYAAGFHEKEEE